MVKGIQLTTNRLTKGTKTIIGLQSFNLLHKVCLKKVRCKRICLGGQKILKYSRNHLTGNSRTRYTTKFPIAKELNPCKLSCSLRGGKIIQEDLMPNADKSRTI